MRIRTMGHRAPAHLVGCVLLALNGCVGTASNPPPLPTGFDSEGGSAGVNTPVDAGASVQGIDAPSLLDSSVAAVSDEAPPGCVPVGCATQGFTCGTTGDRCGHLLNCGSCAAPQFCGRGGANRCGGDVTVATDSPSVKPVAIGAGLWSSCALLSNGTVKCWGLNMYGELGDGTETDSAQPVAVQGLTGAVYLGAQDGYHNCAVLADGTARCWGGGLYGSLGNGGGLDSQTVKVVSNLTSISTICTGGNDTCATRADGTAWCWGEEALANGDLTVPGQVPGLSGVVTIVTSGNDSCALLANATVACFGLNEAGQVGDGRINPMVDPDPYMQVFPPVAVVGLDQVVDVAVGQEDACAVRQDGTVRCWGVDQKGQLGIGMPDGGPSGVPETVTGITNAKAVAVGSYYACALLADGTVACWGDNEDGTLGNGTTVDSSVPVAVTGLSNVVAISTGIEHACALLGDGTVKCWGLNGYGGLGSPPGTELCNGAICSTTPLAVQW
jgi:alpha-tubulin suppressor-like RCC1 family protein